MYANTSFITAMLKVTEYINVGRIIMLKFVHYTDKIFNFTKNVYLLPKINNYLNYSEYLLRIQKMYSV